MALWFLIYLSGIMRNEKQNQPATTLSQTNSDSGKSLKPDILQLTTPTLYSQKF